MKIVLSFGVVALLVLGSIVVVKGLLAFLNLMRIIMTRLDQSWADRYGRNSWAVVTGCTEGIGKAFCFQLASLGFGLVLIARNEGKLQNLSKQLYQKYPNVNILVIKADFLEYSAANYAEIVDKFIHLDISILINDVGIVSFKQFHHQSIGEISDQMKVNMEPMTYLSSAVIRMFLERSHRSAVINLSGHSTTLALKNFSVAIGTKAYNDLLSRCLAEEYRQKIDVLSCRPLLVTTAGTNYVKDSTSIQPRDCARGALKALGKVEVTSGHWFHTIQAWVSTILGQYITKSLYNSEIEKLKQK